MSEGTAPAAESPSEKETALRLYGLTITQYIERIKLRDAAVRSFVVAAGVVGGWASGDLEKRAAILLVIPVLAGGTGFLAAYNSLLVDSILSYCADVLETKTGSIPTFDQHPTFLTTGMRAVRFRVIGYVVTIAVPSIIALYEAMEKGPANPGFLAIWWVALTIAFGGIIVVMYADIFYHHGQVVMRAALRSGRAGPSS